MRKFLIVFFAILLGFSLLPALVSEYEFTNSVGTYTTITDGTVQGTAANDDNSFNAIPIGFDFTFDAIVTSVISINSNGFVTFGATAQTSAVSISNPNANASNRLVAVCNRDLKSKTTGVLMTKLVGDAPNRVFIVQWLNYQRYGTANAGDTLNYQLHLYEGTNVVEIQYGHVVFGNSNLTNNTFQVGLRGNTNLEFSNRSVVIGTNDWATSVAGTINTASCAMSPTVVPAQGQKYTFTPHAVGSAPNPAIVTSPVNNGVDVLLNAHLIWSDGGNGPAGYRVYIGTDNPPTNIVNGTDLGLTTNYAPAAPFAYSTVYYWQIIPYNTFGQAQGCPVWSFTTLSDPSIVAFPYIEGFEGAYFPPLGWSTTGWVRGTATHTGTYCARDLYTPAGTRILMTPRIELTGDKRLKFWWRDSDIAKVANHDTTFCEVSTNGGTTWTNLASLSAPAVEANYHQVIIDLEAYQSTNAYIRWRDVTDGTTSAFGVGLDDIFLDTFIPVYNPPTSLMNVDEDNTVILSWQAPEIADGMTLNGYKIYRDSAFLTTTNALSYTDNSVTNGNTYTYYVTAAYVTPTGESVPTNTVTAHPLAPVFDPPVNLVSAQTAWNAVTLNWLLPTDFEGFEGNTFPPTGWTQTITNTGTAGTSGVLPTWCQVGTVNVDPPIVPHNGTKQAGLWMSFEHQNEWLISPQFICPASANLTFWSYVYQGSTSGDHYYVKISPDNGATWTSLWDASTLPPLQNSYTTPYSINLSAYAGQNVKVAWQAIDGPSNDGLFHVWFVDQVAASGTSGVVYLNTGDFTVANGSKPLNNDSERSLTGVKVYRNGTLFQTLPGTPHQYVDTTVVPGTYIYSVTCYYTLPNGESVHSNNATTVIAPYIFNPPTNLVVVPHNSSAVLTWSAPTSGTPTGYKIYKNTTFVTSVAGDVLTYTNTGLVNGTQCDYYVTATYTQPTGESVASNHVIVTPSLAAPTNLVGTIVSGNSVHLTWNAPVTSPSGVSASRNSIPDRGLTGYRVYQGTHAIYDTPNTTTLSYDIPMLMTGSYTYKVTALYTEAPLESAPSNIVTITGNQDPIVPIVTSLKGNYPNPFNPNTVISYSISKPGYVSLDIYNSLGQKVRTLVDTRLDVGNYTSSWNGYDDKGNSLGTGVYFYKMKSGNFSSTKKMILLK